MADDERLTFSLELNRILGNFLARVQLLYGLVASLFYVVDWLNVA